MCCVQDAIAALNSLQTNSITIKRSLIHNTECKNVAETERYLNKVGITLDDVDKLSVIHVAGTKGKVNKIFFGCEVFFSCIKLGFSKKIGFFKKKIISIQKRDQLVRSQNQYYGI